MHLGVFRIFFFLVILLFSRQILFAQTSAELKTAELFRVVQNSSDQLADFLLAMPKGADLHIHLLGATYAENLLRYAHGENWCINPKNYVVFADPSCPASHLLDLAIKNPDFYNQVIDAWSMRHADSNVRGHDHFFAAFSKYELVAKRHTAEILAEIMNRAESQHISYLELQIHEHESADLISDELDQYEAGARRILQCETSKPSVGCQVKVRYIYETLRENSYKDVYSKYLAGVQAVTNDPRFVGINFVQPEDGKISMRDYALHMRMVGNLSRLYPNVPVSLHAGELVSGLVPAAGLRSHINDAVMIAKARRIGHGLDIAGEDNAIPLLQYMSKHGVLVEINLSSNFFTMHIAAKDHPLPLYMKYHVPVALSTDDEGIERTNLTHQYVLAAEKHHLNYLELKNISRNSLEYSFLPGESLWVAHKYNHMNFACHQYLLGEQQLTTSCKSFLNQNEKASMQMELEKRFVAFESKIAEKYSH